MDGRGPGQYLQEEICGPNELDFRFGLGLADQARAVDLTGLDASFRASQLEGKPPLFERAVMNPPGALDPAVVNGAAWRAAEVPAINGHGTARAVADFYHALEQGRILGKALLAEAITVHASGPDRVFGDDASWGLGFGLDGSDYGMGGIGGSYGGTNQSAGYSIAYHRLAKALQAAAERPGERVPPLPRPAAAGVLTARRQRWGGCPMR